MPGRATGPRTARRRSWRHPGRPRASWSAGPEAGPPPIPCPPAPGKSRSILRASSESRADVRGQSRTSAHYCLDARLFRKEPSPKARFVLFMNSVSLRVYRPTDLEGIKKLTLDSFGGVTIEQNLETALGTFNGHDWRWRKARHIDEDAAANPAGIFIAESDGRMVGYITTRVDRDAGKGRIPNLAVAEEFRGRGLGRELIEHALDYFR